MFAAITVTGCTLSGPACGLLSVYFILPLLILFATIAVMFFGFIFGLQGIVAFVVFKSFARMANTAYFADLLNDGWEQVKPTQAFVTDSAVCSIGKRARVEIELQKGDLVVQLLSVTPKISFMLMPRRYIMVSTKAKKPLPYMLCLQTNWQTSSLLPPKNAMAVKVESVDFEKKFALFVDEDTPQFTYEVLEPVLIEKMQDVDDPISFEINGGSLRTLFTHKLLGSDGHLIQKAIALLEEVKDNVIYTGLDANLEDRDFTPYRNISVWRYLAMIDLCILAGLIFQNHATTIVRIGAAAPYHASSLLALFVVVRAMQSAPIRLLRNTRRKV